MSAPTSDAAIAAAKVRADLARARLVETVGVLKQRTAPQALAHDAAETIKAKSLAVAHDVADAARRSPGATAAVAGGVVLFLLRHHVAGLFRRAVGKPKHPGSSKGLDR